MLKVSFKGGWIAMDKDGTWKWFPKKPVIDPIMEMWCSDPRHIKQDDLYPQKMIYLEIKTDETNWKKTLRSV